MQAFITVFLIKLFIVSSAEAHNMQHHFYSWQQKRKTKSKNTKFETPKTIFHLDGAKWLINYKGGELMMHDN